jgi:hypothetical protein
VRVAIEQHDPARSGAQRCSRTPKGEPLAVKKKTPRKLEALYEWHAMGPHKRDGNSVRRMRIPGGHLYQVSSGSKYGGGGGIFPDVYQGSIWHPPVFVPGTPDKSDMHKGKS